MQPPSHKMIDTIIVGAGPSGLCAAKTILQCEPNAEFTILDAQSTIGGVWAKDKLYPLLKTNHMFGGFDFVDFPMQEGDGVKRGEHIPGTVVHDYLSQYARKWHIDEKIELNVKVEEIKRPESGDGWELKVVSNGRQQIRRCKKLIVAVGMSNLPHTPKLNGSADFQAPLIHSVQLGLKSDVLYGDDSIETVAILGGSKSAYDAAYGAAKAGRQVEWIIRKSGRGPSWVFPLKTQMGPFEPQRDHLAMVRLVTFFSPCMWKDGYSWIRSWITGTAIGRFLATKFWAQLHFDTLKDCGFRTHEKLNLLEPEAGPDWYGTVAGAMTYGPELFEFIKSGQIRIFREDVSHLSKKTVHFSSGGSVAVDAFIAATGYTSKPAIQFNPPSLHSDLGIPTTQMTAKQAEFWRQLDAQTDRAIAQQYPVLAAGPFPQKTSKTDGPYEPNSPAETTYTPFRLHRAIAPPGLTANGDRSLVFIGAFSNITNNARLQLQCLWAYAYLNHRLTIDEKSVFEEASMTNRFSHFRSPLGHGKFFPDHVFDQMPYNDMILGDLGLSPYRKGNFLKELFSPYTAADYDGVVLEWVEKNRKL